MFLEAAFQDFEPGPFHQPEGSPSWKRFAETLDFGKIHE